MKNAPDNCRVEVNAWDVPSATGAGERFRFSVGARCSRGCDLGGQELGLFDQQGAQICTVKLGRDVYPGTEAHYFAGVEAPAPLTAGSYQWEVRTAAGDSELPHAAGSFRLAVRVVGAPECEVTVKAVDRETQTPIKGARVVLHPYRAVTDANGIAKVKVTRGSYDILVAGSKYVPATTSVEVTADMVTCAELDADTVDEIPE